MVSYKNVVSSKGNIGKLTNEFGILEARKLWAKAHSGYYFTKLQERVNKVIIDLLAPSKGDLLLDLGCGSGDYLLLSSRYVAFSIGIDVSKNLLKAAKRKIKSADCLVELIVADANYIPIVDGVFSKVLFSHVIEHLSNYRKTLEEFTEHLTIKES